MKKAKLFHNQSIYSISLVIAGILLTALYLYQEESSSYNFVIGTLLIFGGFLQHLHLKKFYLKYDKNKIVWHFPTSEDEQSIDLNDGQYEVSRNWKGLVFKGATQSFEISLDQFWKRDQKRIAKELESFYA